MIRLPLGASVDDQSLQRFLDGVLSALKALISCRLLDGVLLEGVVLATGANEVQHGLDRRPYGYLVVRKNANQSVWDTQDSNVNPERTLSLVTDGVCTVSLWVF